MASNDNRNASSSNSGPKDDDLLLDQAMLDALIQAAQSPNSGDEPAPKQEKDAGFNNTALSLSQADIDALLNNDELGHAASDNSMESVLSSSPNIDAEPLDQANIDALLAGLSPAPAPVKTPAPPAPVPAASPAASEGTVSQEMIDALIMAATHDEPPASPVVEPPAEKKVSQGLLTQDDLDALMQKAQQEQRERYAAKQKALTESLSAPRPAREPEPAPITEKQGKLHRDVKRPRAPRLPVRVDMLKLVASLATAAIVAAGTFTYLYTHQERQPDLTSVAQLAALRPEPAVPSEPSASTAAAPEPAASKPEPPSEPVAPPLNNTQADKTFAELQSAFLALPENAPHTRIALLHEQIIDFFHQAPNYSKLPEVFLWKASLYEREHETAMAREVYKALLARFTDIPGLDTVLLGAAKAAIALNQPKEASGYAQRLLDERSDSPHVPEAELVLADAYAATNRLEDAQIIWKRLAQAENTPASQRATASLGKAYADHGRYAEAIQLIEPCIDATGKVEGNESLYYAIARAYRGVGRLEDARRRLNDILTFFGGSDLLPATMVELSQVLDELGLRQDAIQMARDAAQRYPANAEILRNEGNLLAASGEKREAAEVLLSALRNGMKDPNVLLDAARDFREAQALPEAQENYERLLAEYPRSPVALDADVERAEVLCARGQARKGIKRLEDLLVVTAEGPLQLPVLFSLAKQYQALGLKTRTAEIYRHIAGLSAEPEVLARAAAALLDAGITDEGLAVAERVDLAKVSEKTAYDLLLSQAEAVEAVNTDRAFAYREKAYTAYPGQRTPSLEQDLMRAYADRDNDGRARELLAALDAAAKQTPADAPRFRESAVLWADHLYDKKDYRSAAELYARVIAGAGAKEPTAVWATYQMGNALFKLDDFDGGVKAFDQVVAAGGEWARDASIKASYARVEQRLRGLPVTAPAQTTGGRG